MSLQKTIIKIVLVFLCISFFVSTKLFEYAGTLPDFMQFAESINFSTGTLGMCLVAAFYLVAILVCVVLLETGIKKTIGSLKNTTENRKELFVIFGIVLLFCGYSFLVNHAAPAIGQKNFASDFAIYVWFSVLVVLGPVAEELFFRVVLIESFEKLYGYRKWKSILFQACLFYGPHFINGNISFLVIYLGLINGILYYHTRSIVFPLVMHALMNLTGFFALANVFRTRWVVELPYMVCVFVVFAVAIICLMRRYLLLQRVSVERNTTD
jgi:membrane protease YdiL (CAAX protease family)